MSIEDNVSEKLPVEDDAAVTNGSRKKQIKVLMRLIFFVLIIAAICVGIWWVFFRNVVSTDDAYVTGSIVVLSSRQDGSVVAYYAEDASYVQKGQLLVQLDPTDLIGNLNEKKAKLALAARNVMNNYQIVQEKKANLVVEQTKLAKAELDYLNRDALISSDAIPKEDYEHAKSQYEVSKASVQLAQHQLDSAESAVAKILEEDPNIEVAKMEFLVAYLQLQRSKIVSPVAGYIAKRNVQVGQNVKAGAPLMNIVPLENIWVEANYKETQLENVRIGQPVKLTADMYGDDVVFDGVVEGFIPGSGSVFSLLPPQNTTGNWIKIVQRVPVRIKLVPEQIKKHNLVLGLSMYAKIDVVDKSGIRFSEKSVPVDFKTDIYDIDLKPAYKMMDDIVKENLNFEGPKNVSAGN
jgi:membrane fusion protein (multidrug efflux system)